MSAERNGDEKCNESFVAALLSGDRRACARISDSALVEAGDFFDVYTGLFQPSMYRVGELWEYNKISVAAEHMASSITEGLMNRVAMDMEPAPAVDKSVVVGSVEGELHQIGAKMVADVFEFHGRRQQCRVRQPELAFDEGHVTRVVLHEEDVDRRVVRSSHRWPRITPAGTSPPRTRTLLFSSRCR